ncbi:MAG: hypothetical protein JWR85_1799 [Marmoricola sp.]|nr:hypothetical protein [Marmoricola sp.]
MTFRMRPPPTVRYALRLGGLLVVLAGLFGMHGLDNHGGAGIDAMSHAAMGVPAAGVAPVHVAIPGADQVSAAIAVVASDAGDRVAALTGSTGHPGMDMGAAGMCMAVLVLSLLIFIMGRYANRSRPVLWLLARPVRSPWVRGRDPDPPSLFRLSIQRC